jgi:hypothetical protein
VFRRLQARACGESIDRRKAHAKRVPLPCCDGTPICDLHRRGVVGPRGGQVSAGQRSGHRMVSPRAAQVAWLVPAGVRGPQDRAGSRTRVRRDRRDRPGSGDSRAGQWRAARGQNRSPRAWPREFPEAAVAGLPREEPSHGRYLSLHLVSCSPPFPDDRARVAGHPCPGLTVFMGLPVSRWWPGCPCWTVVAEASAGGAAPAG